MFIFTFISEPLLYLCFSILMGSFILRIVPSSHRPDFNVKKRILMAATAGIAMLSFIPVLQVIFYLYQDIGFAKTFIMVLFTFEVGKSWIFTYLISNVLFIYIIWFDYRKKTLYAFIGLGLTILLTLALGWSSHASSIQEWKGFVSHTIHFLAVTSWVGILIVVSWASKNYSNWKNFLKWFTPVAVFCFIITVVSGLLLLNVVIDYKDYTNSWMLPYGQSLLIKHLLIIPLIVYAFINSILIRKRIKNDDYFNPIPWVKVESLIIFLIFSVTGVLGQQEPPHDIQQTLTASGLSKLFDLFYQGHIVHDSQLVIYLGINSLLLLALTLCFIGLTITAYMKKAPILFGFTMSIFSVMSLYLSLITAIQ
ncbi:CopD family protein [Caldifermentibacillus hisashii]|uniref:copper resistance D family protein n=1 Tax=Caldifermentibacillus hisashii TaxID=996558 RepID=UPI002E1D93A5|nr:CopD family protein [Caldifermentibacillus hisashii]MED3645137.1 CopD family protein [Caldifermentibacillus hisashii]